MNYGSIEENECLILDDNELNSLSHRLQWRNKDAKSIQSLFQEAKGKRAFPSAFQSFKLEGSAFPYYKNEKRTVDKSLKLEDTLDLSGIILSAEYISKHGIPLLKMPEAKEIDFRPIDLEPLAKPLEILGYDSDSNYPYSQCTPPTTTQYQTVDPHRGQQFSTSSDSQVSSKYNDHPPKRVVNTLVLDGTD
jgi:hypothetical protein